MIQPEVAYSLLAALIVFQLFNRYHKDIVGFYYTKIKHKTNIPRSSYLMRYKYLNKHFDYFKPLSDSAKSEFITRMWNFEQSKKFITSGNITLEPEMKWLVSAAAIQLTFGLKDYMIRSHYQIVLHADAFYLPGSRLKMKGAASQAGTIHLSWPDLKQGFEVPDDRYNLGLHELSHALKMTVLGGKTFDDRLKRYYSAWSKTVKQEFLNLKHGNEHFLRKYGGTNMHEFFAVCIEHFFEVPAGMKKELPELYSSLSVLLNQDPLNAASDYRVSTAVQRKYSTFKTAVPKAKDISWHWSLSLLLIGFFTTIATFIYFDTFFITTVSIIALWLGISLIAGVIHYPSVVKNNIMGIPVYIIYSLIGPAPIFIFCMLLANHFIPLEEAKHIKLNAVHLEVPPRFNGTVVTYQKDLNEGKTLKHVEKVEGYYEYELEGSTMHMMVYRGIFGYKVKSNKYIQRENGKWIEH